MKKYLLISVLFSWLFLTPAAGAGTVQSLDDAGSFQIAKAYKIGRDRQAHSSDANRVDIGGGNVTLKECSEHCSSCNTSTGSCSACESGFTLENGACKSRCPSGYSFSPIFAGCIKDTYMCNIGCAPSGCGIGSTTRPDKGHYITAEGLCPACSAAITGCDTCSQSSLGALPVCTKCQSGYRLLNGKCVENCSGVTCSNGYKATSTSAGCCCEKTTISCPENCSTCSSSATCTKCQSGYYLSGGKCTACPANATCTGTSIFSCNDGYYKSGSACLRCSSTMTGCTSCTSASVCTECSNAYTLSGGKCVSDCDYWTSTGCSAGYRKPKSGGSCTACPANTECRSCASGCSGTTAGTCGSKGYTCRLCARLDDLQAVDNSCTGCTCPRGSYCQNGTCEWDGVTYPAVARSFCVLSAL